MQTLTFQGPRTVAVADRPIPELPDADAVLVRISASGICGSDLQTYNGYAFTPETGFSLGHEAVGTIVETGSGVRTLRNGDRVLIAASAGCLRCHNCATGWVMGCTGEGVGVYGIGFGLDGLQSEFAVVRNADRNVVALSDDIGDDAAVVLTDNLPTGWFAARQAGVRPGGTVAVIGLGPVGLCAVMSAVAMGAARVLAIDPLPDRRAFAERFGAEGAFGNDLVGLVRDLTNGRKVESVIEAVGTDAAIQTAIQLAGVGGTVALAGVPSSATLELPILQLFGAQVTMKPAVCSVQRELPTLISLVENRRLYPERIVTHHFRLSDGALAYRTFAERGPGTGKVVLRAY